MRVVLDTNVLVPAALRDALLRAAVREVYEPYWSAEILAELGRVLVREEMTTAEKARYLVETLQANFPDAAVPDSYRRLIPVVENDPNDRHVLAAAVRVNAHAIITANVRHFPAAALDPYGIEARTPDAFLVDLFSLDPAAMCESIVRQAEALRYGRFSVAGVLEGLGHDAPQFAALVRGTLPRMSHLQRRLADLERR
jgi:predicted nucleic acid-binding protein